MKRRQTANLIMVFLIAAIVLGGCLLAVRMKQEAEPELGTDFQIGTVADGVLAEAGEKTCTVTIVCDTILEHLDGLVEGKSPYVPKDGVILPQTCVSFAEGDTVFQVLQTVCTAADIQIEYSWTPLYDSYYIEGINHLYEFDCGPESGWMYKVNGSFPNYGCSAYELTGGENIVWCYTCTGLGEDLGATEGM